MDHDRAVKWMPRCAQPPIAKSMPSATQRAGCNSLMLRAITRVWSSARRCSDCLAKQRTDHIPWVTYTDPELAQVGLTEAEATTSTATRWKLCASLTTRMIGPLPRARPPAIKVMVLKGRPVGASIAGAQAGELIGVWALAIANNMKMSAVAAMVAPYPDTGRDQQTRAGAYFSPRLFDNPKVKWVVRFVQKYLP